MSALVVDASVVAAALFPEPLHDAAATVLVSGGRLLAPDLLVAELGNVAWKRYRRGELLAEEAQAMLSDARRIPIELTPSAALVDAALSIAVHTGRSVYDSLYLALAVASGTVMVTADRRLVNACAGTPFAPHLALLGDRADPAS